MTKKDLERRNHFLLLQLKIISELIKEMTSQNKNNLFEDRFVLSHYIGVINAHTDPEFIKDCIKFIEENNKSYNFYNKEMNIDEYKD